ncbi:MAG: hypothetical protein M1835_000140 [Candelina submexicana]|nr:MAG: hypothetical protein M1835_000140 [Candelina submexicana]
MLVRDFYSAQPTSFNFVQLMPLLRPLPPQFLLPAWNYRLLHSGPAWVHAFAPKPETSDEKAAASEAENAQETSLAPDFTIKRYLATKKLRLVNTDADKSLRWLNPSDPRPLVNNEHLGISLVGEGRRAPRPTVDGTASNEGLGSPVTTRDGGRQKVVSRKTQPLASGEEQSTSLRKSSQNVSRSFKQEQATRRPAPHTARHRIRTGEQRIRFVAADDEKGVKHLELSNGNMIIPSRNNEVPFTDLHGSAGAEDRTITPPGSCHFHDQSSSFGSDFDPDTLDTSPELTISRPWPVIDLGNSDQEKSSNLGSSKTFSSSMDDGNTSEAEPRPGKITFGSDRKKPPWGLPNESLPGASGIVMTPNSRRASTQPRWNYPVAKISRSSTSRAVSLTRDGYPKESKKEPTPNTPALSLLEELFPTEAKRYQRERDAAQKTERQVPRLLLSADMSNLDNPRAALDRVSKEQAALKNELRLKRQQYLKDFRRREISVLLLGCASKSLVEEDFRRISPKGKHVEGWKAEGDILKVIPRRDPTTLEPLGQYFLLFSSPSSAHAYYNHVRQQHQISRTHTPRSLSSPIAPPPGYLVDGQDVHALLQDYALKPPSQSLNLKRLKSPLTPYIRDLVNQGGYAQLIASESKSEYPILFTIDGSQPSTHAISEAIGHDGRKRGLPWALSTSKNAIKKLEDPTPPQTATEDAQEKTDSSHLDASIDEPEKTPSHQTRYRQPRWIISFQNEAEAQRFVRMWHRRAFPMPRGAGSIYGEPPPMVNAEILW